MARQSSPHRLPRVPGRNLGLGREKLNPPGPNLAQKIAAVYLDLTVQCGFHDNKTVGHNPHPGNASSFISLLSRRRNAESSSGTDGRWCWRSYSRSQTKFGRLSYSRSQTKFGRLPPSSFLSFSFFLHPTLLAALSSETSSSSGWSTMGTGGGRNDGAAKAPLVDARVQLHSAPLSGPSVGAC